MSEEESQEAIRIRVSNRKRKRRVDDNPDNDAEFNRLLKQHEKTIDEAEKIKEERKATRKTIAEAKKAKKHRREAVVEHADTCDICNSDGELILCETCPRAFHLGCAELIELPEGEWFCATCEEEGKDVHEDPDDSDKKNNVTCTICKEGKNLLNCESCVNSYHAYCLNPPLKEIPAEGEWNCPKCLLPDPGKKAEKILSWRYLEIKYPDPIAKDEKPKDSEEATEEQQDAQILKPSKKMPPRREKEFFIKWNGMSYWHCTWVSELMMDKYFPQLLRMCWKKFDPDIPPEVDDGSNEDVQKGETEGKEKEDDPHNLEENFYRYGIKPEWMQDNMIIW
uniref:Uncharacterized protein n=1 Tax=Panagrolaimus superbus TaxID=310955 RepID=A0A914Y5I8_9BILA